MRFSINFNYCLFTITTMGTSEEEEEEEYLVHVEFDSLLDSDTFEDPNLFFKVIGIDSEKPILQIGDQVFTGTYNDIPGTSLFFEEDENKVEDDAVFAKTAERTLKYKYKTRKSLVMRRVFIKKKDLNPSNSENTKHDEMMEDDEINEMYQLGMSGEKIAGRKSDIQMELAGVVEEGVKHQGKQKKTSVVDKENKKCDETKKSVKKVKSNIEPVAGPSWAPDITPDSKEVLDTTINADEMSRLIAEQMTLESDINLQNSSLGDEKTK